MDAFLKLKEEFFTRLSNEENADSLKEMVMILDYCNPKDSKSFVNNEPPKPIKLKRVTRAYIAKAVCQQLDFKIKKVNKIIIGINNVDTQHIIVTINFDNNINYTFEA